MLFRHEDFEIENGVLTAYRGSDVCIVIPDGVRAIGKHAFLCLSRIEAVTIPDSVVEIGEGAFSDCFRLQSMTLPRHLTKIGKYAFEDCRSLKSINIPSGVTELPTGVFMQSGLERLVIPPNVTNICDSAFMTCFKLESITISPGVKTIGHAAFANCRSLSTVTLSDGLEAIGAGAFSDCKNLKSINLPDSLVRIGERAFRNCRLLKLVNEPNGLVEIGENAFSGAGAAVEAALKAAARRNHKLDSACIATVTGLRRHKNADELLCADINGHSVIVGKTCRIGQRVVYFPVGCRLDEQFAREQHLLRVKGENGSQAGGYVDPVSRVVAPLRLRGERSEGLALPIESLSTYTDIETLRDGDRFSVLNGHRICRTVIPDSMEIVFRERTLVKYHSCQADPRKLYLPWGLEAIEKGAFMHCSYLVEVVIPETVKRIGNQAFYDCPNLKRIVIPDSVISIGDEAFVYCGGSAPSVVFKGRKEIQLSAFLPKDFELRNGTLVRYHGGLRTVVIPDGVTEIGDNAFLGNGMLERVVISAGVKRIGNSAFLECRRLREVFIPDSVTSIGSAAFFKCRALRDVTIPASTESIGEHAFGYYFFFRYLEGAKFPLEEYRRYRHFRIHCEKGSAAETYARNNLLTCVTKK